MSEKQAGFIPVNFEQRGAKIIVMVDDTRKVVPSSRVLSTPETVDVRINPDYSKHNVSIHKPDLNSIPAPEPARYRKFVRHAVRVGFLKSEIDRAYDEL